MIRRALTTCMLISAFIAAEERQPSLSLAGVELQIGAPQEEVLQHLRKVADVRKRDLMNEGDISLWEVRSQTDQGHVDFQNGKLDSVARYEACAQGPDAVAFFNQVFDALDTKIEQRASGVRKGGYVRAGLSTETWSRAGFGTQRSIDITLPNHIRITLVLDEVKKPGERSASPKLSLTTHLEEGQ